MAKHKKISAEHVKKTGKKRKGGRKSGHKKHMLKK